MDTRPLTPKRLVTTDRGSQYTSRELISLLEGYGIQVGMDGVGISKDNIFVERT